MKLELKENMYVRNCYGRIAKIEYIEDNIAYCDNWLYQIYEECIRFMNLNDEEDINEITKASYSIIDILEVGDYVNGSEVLDFENKYIEEKDTFVPIGVVTENCYLEDTDSWIIEKNIKSVITHEQIEQMAYKVGE